MKKYLYIALGIILGASSLTYAATTIVPTFTGGTGTSTPSGILYGDNGATTHLNTVTIGSNLTFSGGTLSATGGGGSGTGTVSTSTVPTVGNLAYWTSAGYPSLLGTVATTSVTCGTGTACTSFTAIGGSPVTITANGTFPFTVNTWGNSTTSTLGFLNGFLSTASSTISSSLFLSSLAQGNAYIGSNGLVQSSATTTLTGTAPIVFSNPISVLGATPSVITCTSASAGVTGCLTGTDWSTFNSKGSGSVTSVGLSSTNSTLTVGSTPVTTSGTITADLNLGHSNIWTSLQSFANNASSTGLSAGYASIGTSATTTITNAGFIGIGSTTPYAQLSVNSLAGSPAFVIGSSTATSFLIDKNGNTTNYGSLTLPLMSLGSIPFLGTGGLVSQNINNLYWDNVNLRLSIGNQVGIVSPQNMTSDSLPVPYVASASGESTGFAYQAFAGGVWGTAWNGGPQFLKIDLGTVTSIGSYQFAASGSFNKAVNWTLQGSNDNSAFTVIDTQAGISFSSAGTPILFTLSQNQSYRYYKLNFTANNGDAAVQVNNLIYNGASNLASAKQQIFTEFSTEKGQIIQAAASQTADLSQWQNSGSTAMSIVNASGQFAIGTSTTAYPLTAFSSTLPQISLSAGAGLSQWTLRNAGGNLYFATTTTAGTATSTNSALSIINGGFAGFVGVSTSTPDSWLDINGNVRFEGRSSFVTASISGAIVGLGCDSTVTTVVDTTLSSTTAFITTPQTYPGDGLNWFSYLSGPSSVTTKVCSDVTVTPAASTYNVKVIK